MSRDIERAAKRPGASRLAVASSLLVLLAAARVAAQDVENVPRTWDPEGMASFELPLADPSRSPQHVPPEYYYALPVRPIYRSYPIYHPDREPAGYRERLRRLEPEVLFGDDELPEGMDLVEAGALVFDAPIGYDGPIVTPQRVQDPEWYRSVGIPLATDGTLPFVSWVIREKGRLEVGNLACSMCHSRVMADGSVLRGAQGNFPLDPSFAVPFLRQLREEDPDGVETGGFFKAVTYELVAAPWVPEEDEKIKAMSPREIAEAFAAVPDGVIVRQGTNLFLPARIPDLIGIEDRRYLDATGFVRHRSAADLMRYAAVNQTLDMLAAFGDFIPAGIDQRTLPEPGSGGFVGTGARYSDLQLYALTQFLYSLEPPRSPHPFDEAAARGQEVFRREGCERCHTPPLYTNNKIIPAPGFEPPASHRRRYDVLDTWIGTDPTLTTKTRRGTGYYKVPSLSGVWYRGPFEHNGSIAELEDWFDPARLEPDYVPSAWRRPGARPRPVEGHPFGLALGADDKKALVAFLRTL